MRFKKIAVLFLFLVASFTLDAYYFDIQARVGAYYKTSHQANQAFKKSIPVYQLEASCFFSEPWNWVPWKFFVNTSFMAGSGHSDNLGRTGSNLTTLSLGLKHSWMIDCYGQFYLGFGPSLSWIRVKPHEMIPEGFWDGNWHGHRKVSEKNFGAVFKSGFQFNLWDRILADIFCDYSLICFHYKDFSKKHMHKAIPAVNRVYKHSRREGHHRLDVSGFIVGGALGFPF